MKIKNRFFENIFSIHIALLIYDLRDSGEELKYGIIVVILVIGYLLAGEEK